MPRKARNYLTGMPYHVVQRGNNPNNGVRVIGQMILYHNSTLTPLIMPFISCGRLIM
jgi:hypothetical protein